MELAGHKCVGFCEFDKFAVMSYTIMHLATEEQREHIKNISVQLKKDGNPNLSQRQKEVLKDEYKNGEWYANDIRTVRASDIPRADCWCLGFPCQDISVAGKQLGFAGHRSSLFFTVTKLVGELPEESRPKYLLIENVKNLLSVNGGFDFAKLLVELDEIGYDAEWQVVNSKNFGVPHNRERVFIIGHLRGTSYRKVFPVSGTDAKNHIRQIGNFMPTVTRKNPNQGRIYDVEGMAPCLNKMDGGGREPHVALPLFCDLTKNAPFKTTEKARCIQARYHKGMSNMLAANSGIAIPALTPDRANKRQNGRRFKENGEPMFTLTGQDRHGIAVAVKEATKKGYAIAQDGDAINLSALGSKTRRGRVGKGVANTLDTSCNQGIIVQVSDTLEVYAMWSGKYNCYIAIRRLTPRECSRLQGWEDKYFDRAALVNSDSQLYKQYGNGVTVTVIEAIGRRL